MELHLLAASNPHWNEAGCKCTIKQESFSQTECNSKTHSKLPNFLLYISVEKVLKHYLPCEEFS